MEWFRIKTSSLLMRVAVDEIVYVKADGNYCDLVLVNGRSRRLTFRLKHFDENFKRLQNADLFIRVGRSLIVNRQYVQIVDLMDQIIIFGGKHLLRTPVDKHPQVRRPDLHDGDDYAVNLDLYMVKVSRDALKQLKETLERG